MYTVVVRHQNGSLISENEIHTDYYHAPHKKLQSATLELEENTAGTFTFTVPKGQMGNNGNLDIDIKSDEVIVFQNPDVRPDAPTGRGKEIWRGFFLENNTEFFNSKTFTCIGELAYLNETVQKDATYKFEGDNEYPEKVFKALLGVHNAKVPEKKQFLPGNVTVKADNTAAHLVNKVQTDEFSTTYSDHTFDCIKKLIDSCGGYLKVRWENGTRYLDWLTAYEANGQTINFGKNLLDYAVEQDVTDLITVLYPFGESVSQEVDDGQGGTTTKRSKVNIGTATGQNGRLFITLNDTGSYSPDPMTELGWREGTVDFPNVRDPNNLKRLAINYLKNQWDPDLKLYTKIQIKAVDLAYFTDEDADPIEFLQSVKVTSTPHGITNKVVPVTKMTIPLLQPEQTIYTMSTAMRKTKQISTSVTDHDKDIEKTQDTVDDIGGGEEGEGEGEGEVVIEGKDPTDDWVIGKPTVGKEPSKEGESEYLKHQKHLKVWYDMAGEVKRANNMVSIWQFQTPGTSVYAYIENHGPYSSNPNDLELIPYNNDTVMITKAGYYPAGSIGKFKTYTDDDDTTYVMQSKEPLGGPMSMWRPSYVSDDLYTSTGQMIDDKESRTVTYTLDGTTHSTVLSHAFSDIHSPMAINVYYSQRYEQFIMSRPSSEDYSLSPVRDAAIECSATLDDPITTEWFNLEWGLTPGFTGDPKYDGIPMFSSRYPSGETKKSIIKKIDDARSESSRFFGKDCRIFGAFTKGVMPVLQRPLVDGGAQSVVIYAVANFKYGINMPSGSRYISCPGIADRTKSFGIFRPKSPWPHISDYEAARLNRLCQFYNDVHRCDPIGFYQLDSIIKNPSGSGGAPVKLNPGGRWWVYAWISNVGPGKKYNLGSYALGGLLVCTVPNGIWASYKKWITEYNNGLSSKEKTVKKVVTYPEFTTTDTATQQHIFINGLNYETGFSRWDTRAYDGTVYEYPKNADRVGHWGYGGEPGYGQTDDTFSDSAMGLRAIGYCRAAYNQITMDEVVENMAYLYNKYC